MNSFFDSFKLFMVSPSLCHCAAIRVFMIHNHLWEILQSYSIFFPSASKVTNHCSFPVFNTHSFYFCFLHVFRCRHRILISKQKKTVWTWLTFIFSVQFDLNLFGDFVSKLAAVILHKRIEREKEIHTVRANGKFSIYYRKLHVHNIFLMTKYWLI